MTLERDLFAFIRTSEPVSLILKNDNGEVVTEFNPASSNLKDVYHLYDNAHQTPLVNLTFLIAAELDGGLTDVVLEQGYPTLVLTKEDGRVIIVSPELGDLPIMETGFTSSAFKPPLLTRVKVINSRAALRGIRGEDVEYFHQHIAKYEEVKTFKDGGPRVGTVAHSVLPYVNDLKSLLDKVGTSDFDASELVALFKAHPEPTGLYSITATGHAIIKGCREAIQESGIQITQRTRPPMSEEEKAALAKGENYPRREFSEMEEVAYSLGKRVPADLRSRVMSMSSIGHFDGMVHLVADAFVTTLKVMHKEYEARVEVAPKERKVREVDPVKAARRNNRRRVDVLSNEFPDVYVNYTNFIKASFDIESADTFLANLPNFEERRYRFSSIRNMFVGVLALEEIEAGKPLLEDTVERFDAIAKELNKEQRDKVKATEKLAKFFTKYVADVIEAAPEVNRYVGPGELRKQKQADELKEVHPAIYDSFISFIEEVNKENGDKLAAAVKEFDNTNPSKSAALVVFLGLDAVLILRGTPVLKGTHYYQLDRFGKELPRLYPGRERCTGNHISNFIEGYVESALMFAPGDDKIQETKIF